MLHVVNESTFLDLNRLYLLFQYQFNLRDLNWQPLNISRDYGKDLKRHVRFIFV